VLLNYPKLSCIYFHGNKISHFREVDKLAPLEHLAKVTLHGNPVEDMNNYRWGTVSGTNDIIISVAP